MPSGATRKGGQLGSSVVSESKRTKHRWSTTEIRSLKTLYQKESIQGVVTAFPNHTWGSIQGKAGELGLRRPRPAPIRTTLKKEGDVGFCSGMVLADGSVLEGCISSGARRAKHEGGAARPRRYYSLPQVRISMEDKESLDRVARLWGRKTTLAQTSSVGNKVWSVQVGGKKALDLLRLMLPYMAGPKRKRGLYLLDKYKDRTSFPVLRREDFSPFRGLI
jgi:hypothetical protein